jgi:hypothetical protein
LRNKISDFQQRYPQAFVVEGSAADIQVAVRVSTNGNEHFEHRKAARRLSYVRGSVIPLVGVLQRQLESVEALIFNLYPSSLSFLHARAQWLGKLLALSRWFNGRASSRNHLGPCALEDCVRRC